MSFMIATILVDCLIAGRYLLHGPAVAVRIAEEDEPHVVEILPSTSQARRIPVQHLDSADLHPSLDGVLVLKPYLLPPLSVGLRSSVRSIR